MSAQRLIVEFETWLGSKDRTSLAILVTEEDVRVLVSGWRALEAKVAATTAQAKPESAAALLQEDLRLVNRIDGYGKNLSLRETEMIESFLRRLEVEKRPLSNPQRVIALQIEGRRVE